MSINDYIKKFDENFNTSLSKSIADNTHPMLEFSFNNLGEKLYATNDASREISKQKAVVAEQLDATLNDEQKTLLDKYFDLDAELLDDVHKQLLIFGFCLCYEQLREMNALKI